MKKLMAVFFLLLAGCSKPVEESEPGVLRDVAPAPTQVPSVTVQAPAMPQQFATPVWGKPQPVAAPQVATPSSPTQVVDDMASRILSTSDSAELSSIALECGRLESEYHSAAFGNVAAGNNSVGGAAAQMEKAMEQLKVAARSKRDGNSSYAKNSIGVARSVAAEAERGLAEAQNPSLARPEDSYLNRINKNIQEDANRANGRR